LLENNKTVILLSICIDKRAKVLENGGICLNRTSGIIDGMEPVGQMFSGLMFVAINEKSGWDNFFNFFVIMSLVGGGLAALKSNFKSPEKQTG